MPDREIRFIDFMLQRDRINAEIKEAIAQVLETQQFILGKGVEKLEAEIAAKMGAKFAIGVASGSDALYLALWALGVGPGDEVIAPPFTFFATAGAISRTGATPVFADIDPKTFNLSPAEFEKKITKRTKAVVPVHLFGLSADLGAIQKIAQKHGIRVVEDAAQSFGATYQGRQTASLGDAGCLSFFPTKNLGGAGDGGMVTTSSPEVADKVRMLRVHGSKQKYYHEIVGINSRLDEIQAAVLSVKLRYVDAWNRARTELAACYDKELKGVQVETPFRPEGYGHVYHLYSILTDRRDDLAAFLKKKGVSTAVYYQLPLHLQPCYAGLGHRKGDFPVSENSSARVLSLPMYPELSLEEAGFVAKAVKEFFGK